MVLVLFNLIEVAKFPEQHQQLLMELDFLGGMGQVRLSQRVGQETSEALQYKIKVLQTRKTRTCTEQLISLGFYPLRSETTITNLLSVNPGQVIDKQVLRACRLHKDMKIL